MVKYDPIVEKFVEKFVEEIDKKTKDGFKTRDLCEFHSDIMYSFKENFGTSTNLSGISEYIWISLIKNLLSAPYFQLSFSTLILITELFSVPVLLYIEMKCSLKKLIKTINIKNTIKNLNIGF